MSQQVSVDSGAGPPEPPEAEEAEHNQQPAWRRRTRGARENLLPFVAAFAVLGVWQIAVPVFGIEEFVLPTPAAIITHIFDDQALLLEHGWVSLAEVLYGFALSVVLGIPMALAIFYWRVFEKTAYPFLVILQTIPKVALAPILVLWFGHQLAPKVLVAFLISFFPIVISTVVGLRSLDKEMVYLVRSMGANEWQTFYRLRLPAALPNIFGGFKTAIGLAVVGAIIGEYVASDAGLGYLQLQATARFDTVGNFAALTVISLMGVALFFIVAGVERLVMPWERNDKESE